MAVGTCISSTISISAAFTQPGFHHDNDELRYPFRNSSDISFATVPCSLI